MSSTSGIAGPLPCELVPENQTVPLAILLAQPDATFSRLLAPGLTVEARDPIVLVEDFNQDGTPDMAVFDAGVYATAESTGYGNPPHLLLSRPDFTHELSSAPADAVAAHRHSLGPDLPGEPFTGRHVQVLINQGGMEFEDETVSWMGDQSATHIQVRLAGGPQMVISTATNAPTLWCRAPAMIIRSSTTASATASSCRTAPSRPTTATPSTSTATVRSTSCRCPAAPTSRCC